MTDVGDEDFSVLDYARLNGLSRDYTTELHDIDAPSDEIVVQDLQESTDDLNANSISQLIKERLVVNRDAALFLKAALSCPDAPPTKLTSTDKREWMIGLKQELPILPTDSDLDLLNFGSAALPDLGSLNIPSEVINEENDEGLQWPSKYFAYPAQSDAQVRSEKLAVSREVLLYLQNAVRDEVTPEEIEKAKAETLNSKSKTTRHITPPLLPLSPSMSPYVPSSPANQLPLPSSSNDSVAAEAKALEQEIMAADSLERKCSDSSDSMLLDNSHPPQISPLSFINYETPSLKRRADALKVEGPLTPPMFSTSPLKKLKSVSFARTLDEYIPDAAWWRTGSSDDGVDSDLDFDELFKDIEPIATQAQKKIENEQLSGADTTSRVEVPVVDFTLPIAPWNEYSQRKGVKDRLEGTELDAQMVFLLRIKREDLKTGTSWHGLSALERTLHWSILTTKVSSINLEEKLHGESDLDKFVAELTTSDIVHSSSLIWKSEGLRILDQDDEEEEIESEENKEQRDMEALVRKRKFEMEEEAAEASRKRTVPGQDLKEHNQPYRQAESHHRMDVPQKQHTSSSIRSKTVIHPHDPHASQASGSRRRTLRPPAESNSELMFGGFSASTALHRFMETRGKPIAIQHSDAGGSNKPQRHQTHRPMALTLPVRSREPSLDEATISTQHPPVRPQVSKSRSSHPAMALNELPVLPKDIATCSFIVSSTFLQQRHLFKEIERLYPNADIVYRDYSLPHCPAMEADILLSPSTGLIFITLQQVKQRALPGQPDSSPLKKRMIVLSERSERLFVMISEGLSREMEELGASRPEDPRDKESIARFEAFAAQREGEVLVKYVRGGEIALARAVVGDMITYGLVHGSVDIGNIKPSAEETTWEVFLRRAGFNAYAAQIIAAKVNSVSELHMSNFSSTSGSSQLAQTMPVSGLSAFLAMKGEQRVHRFQAIMGGSRILKRISKMLDQEWVSAAHGFKM